MFIDEAVIKIKAGDGGNGCYSHHRMKYKPRGKPDGGNGGRGGNIIIEASQHVHTLQDVSYHHLYKAERGQHGKGSDKYGKHGSDIIIPVPAGTLLLDDATQQLLFDFVSVGDRFVAALGGRGGRGNAALITRNNPNPQHAEYGKPGEEKTLRLNLKVLADVGLVGRPNAGKSTFLSAVSKAHPKIADYPFTTTQPNLGIVKLHDQYESFVVADIPGLIEGSHEGKGLGIRFLKHIERTRVLAIMVESLAEDPEAEATLLINELKQYSPILAAKPKCFILTKSDLFLAEEQQLPTGWFSISSVQKEGLKETLSQLKNLLDTSDSSE